MTPHERRTVAVLAAVLILVHLPSLGLGRLRDDLYVLDKCARLSFTSLMVEGFRFQTVDFGSPWWVAAPDVAHFFRPLVLASLKLPLLIPPLADGLNHLVNLLLHLGTVVLLLRLARRCGVGPRAAAWAALTYGLSLHVHWTVLWISGRKELMVALLGVGALTCHGCGRWRYAALLVALALLSGEHAVALPLLFLLWSLAGPRAGLPPAAVRPVPGLAWVSYGAVILAYVGLRFLALGGVPLPIAPYYTSPATPGFTLWLVLKLLLLVTALLYHLPYLDRPILGAWLDHPLLLLGTLAAVAAGLWALTRAARPRPLLVPFFFLLALAGSLPYAPMVAAPIYMTVPALFGALALAAALDGPMSRPAPTRSPVDRLVIVYGGATLLVFAVATALWSYGPFNGRAAYPRQVLASILSLPGVADTRRPLILVDVPYQALTLPHLVARATGRSHRYVTVASLRFKHPPKVTDAVITARKGRVELRYDGAPLFDTAWERFVCFVPQGVCRPGAVVERRWLTVKIDETGPEPVGAGQRFFGTDPSVRRLELTWDPSTVQPLVIRFEGLTPRLVPTLASPPSW